MYGYVYLMMLASIAPPLSSGLLARQQLGKSSRWLSTLRLFTSPYHLEEVPVHSKLHKVVRNHALTSSKWTECHRTSSHTIEAMDVAIKFLEAFHSVKNPNVKAPLPVIFDSGCGTGRSSGIL